MRYQNVGIEQIRHYDAVARACEPAGGIEALTAAWRHGSGGDEPGLESVQKVADWGWSAADLDRLGVLLRDATSREVYPVADTDPGLLFMRMTESIPRIARQCLLTPAVFLRWLTVEYGAPDTETLETIDAMLEVDVDDRVIGNHYLNPWTLALPGDTACLAPLAYAAGLTAEEAGTRAATGDLDARHLLTLALLRGYRLPAWIAEAA